MARHFLHVLSTLAHNLQIPGALTALPPRDGEP
jgi:hypothetical protein